MAQKSRARIKDGLVGYRLTPIKNLLSVKFNKFFVEM